LLAEGHILEDQIPLAAKDQRRAADNYNELLQHGSIVAGIWGAIQLGRVLARDRVGLGDRDREVRGKLRTC